MQDSIQKQTFRPPVKCVCRWNIYEMDSTVFWQLHVKKVKLYKTQNAYVLPKYVEVNVKLVNTIKLWN